MVNFYRRFLPNVAEVMAPLTKVLKGQPRKLIWNEQLELAFQAAKRLFSQSMLLAHPRDGATLQLVTDASSNALGAMVQQIVDGNPQPLAFFSRPTTPAESRYSQKPRSFVRREALASPMQ